MTIVISTQPPTAATVEPEYREEVREMTIELDRRELLRTGAGAGAALGVAALGFPSLAEAYRLQAAFHRAKTTQDIELMMSLWAEEATLTNQGDANSPYVGSDRVRAFGPARARSRIAASRSCRHTRSRSICAITRASSTSSATT
jgi:hypothetical protein